MMQSMLELLKQSRPALLKWISLTAIIYLIRVQDYEFDPKKLLHSASVSLALTLLWEALRSSTRTWTTDTIQSVFEKLPRSRVTIKEQAIVDGIRQAPPLWNYYSNWLANLPRTIDLLQSGSPVKVAPHIIYEQILYCTEHCCESIISVDCDIGAWYYTCEPADFEAVYAKDPQKLEAEKRQFLHDRPHRERTDMTAKLASAILARFDTKTQMPLPGSSPVRRVFIVRHKREDLPPKERMILRRMWEIQKRVKGAVKNRVLFLPDLDQAPQKERDLLTTVQDVVIFDKLVAFREFLLEPADARAGEGEVWIDPEQVKRLTTDAEFIFEHYAQAIDTLKELR
jgi:hypothetical protein